MNREPLLHKNISDKFMERMYNLTSMERITLTILFSIELTVCRVMYPLSSEYIKHCCLFMETQMKQIDRKKFWESSVVMTLSTPSIFFSLSSPFTELHQQLHQWKKIWLVIEEDNVDDHHSIFLSSCLIIGLYRVQLWRENVDDSCCSDLLMDRSVGISGENIMKTSMDQHNDC